MQRCRRISDVRAAIRSQRQAGQHVAFVPTMGNLHEGHISLVRRALELSDYVVVSIFVNPLQFGANEDLANYPRTLEDDQQKLLQEGVSLLFLPEEAEMYPHGRDGHSNVQVPGFNAMLCGESRPVHFDGVTTVVNKLFNIIQPNSAVFGEKDYQQLFIIRKMVRDLSMPIDIIGAPIVREDNGLAMSSRNNYLSEEQRDRAAALSRVIREAAARLSKLGATASLIHEEQNQARAVLEAIGFKVDYFEIRDALTLDTPGDGSNELVILAAAYMGETRLIDNLTIANGYANNG